MEKHPKLVRIAGALAICALGGAVCAWIHTPLPWMIGSMFAMAAAQMAGAHLVPLPGGRDAGMAVVGTSLGLYFTAPVVHEVSTFWPWFVALGFAAIAFGAVSGWILQKLSHTDGATAFFGSMPGGASEMAMMGEKYGAATDRVALAHSIRMLFVVTLFPIGITLGGFHATEDYRPVVLAFEPVGLALLLAITATSGWLARRMELPTAYMLGALIASIALTVSGISLSSVPTPVTNAAQVLLGCTLGARFDRDFISKAPRFIAAVVPSVLAMLAMAALVGWGISVGAGVYIGAGLLAAAPGGIAEMSITAKVLRIGVAFVTAAHVVRYLIVVIFTVPAYRLLGHAARRMRPAHPVKHPREDED